ncbi:MAG: thiamine diphosphokinase [Lachnospiraceae bacterium]|nr:thiamine diphosphokinase [Lachnospiraceae bacterium]
MSQTLIFCGGIYNLEFCQQFLENKKFDNVICTDSGLEAAYKLNIIPHIIMGDFDSVDLDILGKYSEGECEVLRFPPEKDETDLELAILECTKRGFSDVVILGATGGRADQYFANIHLLYFALKNNIRAEIYDEFSKIYMENKGFRLKKSELYGKYISLLPFGGDVTGLSIKGLKYVVSDFDLEVGRSRGISNQFLESASDVATAEVDFKNGVILVVESRD